MYDSIISAVRAEYADAWAAGEAMTLDQAVDEASLNAGAGDRPEA